MNDNGTEEPRATNAAIPVWAIIHNVAMWSGGVLWANGSPVWAILVGTFGVWSLLWMVGLMRGLDEANARLGREE